MNHDYAHCLNFREDCPQKCFRAQLVRDLKVNPGVFGIWISWMWFKGAAECMRRDSKHDRRE